MRAIPAGMDPQIVADIDERLQDVARTHDVRIPWAIESGSRAWGFPSPDSDYDCRFIYVRHPSAYLTLWRVRDVIETPLDHIFDVNGWDLAKAVRLIAKGNVAAIEWLQSPIVYSGDEGFRDRLLALGDEIMPRDAVGRHYLHVGRRQLHIGSGSLKRFFYALRPAAALRWMDDHPEAVIPPMDLPTLLAESSVTSQIRDAASELIAAKAVTRELGAGTPPGVLEDFVAAELERGAVFDVRMPDQDRQQQVCRRADEWFLAELDRG
ncbi:nucleotidyltransferase domain-containing protein [Microbacterium mangrovi]|uniref:nucleotidyltransferase domain-containing protein n=1 Tax=Microbacterium mangrovi TaxID=1348253 RepID=UPI00068C07CE|nr:nucleotidyltransferase domain-containing protein [Microbacterium mangrovi]